MKTLKICALGSLAWLIVAIHPAEAAPQTWANTGTTGADWSNSDNWSGTAPGNTSSGGTATSDTATFNSAIDGNGYGSSASPILVDSGRTIGSILFTGAAGNYFVGSTGSENSLYLNNINGSIQIDNHLTNPANAVITETINAPLILTGSGYTLQNNSQSGTVAGAGILNIGGSISGGNTAATTLTLRGTNTNANTISGTISNGTSTGLGIKKTDAGTWALSGLNTFTGSVQVLSGTLSFNTIADGGSASALGEGTTIVLGQGIGSPGILNYTGTTASSNRAIQIGNGASGGGETITVATADQTLTLSGGITTSTPGNASMLTLGGAGNGRLTGGITNASNLSLTMNGTGAWTLAGANGYTGSTTANSGALFVSNASGAGALSVARGATFGANGSSFQSTGSAAFTLGGTSGTGTATVYIGQGSASDTNTMGRLTLQSAAATSKIANANLIFNLAADASGSNVLDLGSTPLSSSFFTSSTLTLNIVGSGVVAFGSTYVLITDSNGFANSGLVFGTDGQITSGLSIAGNSFFGTSSNGYASGLYGGSHLFVNGNNIELEVVPEPGIRAMMLGGMALLVLWRRRKDQWFWAGLR